MALKYTVEELRQRLARVIEEDKFPLEFRMHIPVTSETNTGQEVLIEKVHNYTGKAIISTWMPEDFPEHNSKKTEQTYRPKYISESFSMTKDDMLRQSADNDLDRETRVAQRIVRETDEQFLMYGDGDLGVEGFFNVTGRNLFPVQNGAGGSPLHVNKTALECWQDILDSIHNIQELQPNTNTTTLVVDKIIWGIWSTKVFDAQNTTTVADKVMSELVNGRGIDFYNSKATKVKDSNGFATWALMDVSMDNIEIKDVVAPGENALEFQEIKRTHAKTDWGIWEKTTPIIRRPYKITVAEGATNQ